MDDHSEADNNGIDWKAVAEEQSEEIEILVRERDMEAKFKLEAERQAQELKAELKKSGKRESQLKHFFANLSKETNRLNLT